MAIIRTLFKITEVFMDYESIEQAYQTLGRTVFFKEIYACAKNVLESFHGSEIGYILDFCQDDNGWLAGISTEML